MTNQQLRKAYLFRQTNSWQSGLTLIELLVVIAIIGVLVGLLMPAISAARESANRAACANNLKQLGLALDLHHGTHNGYPVDGENGYGIAVFLLPFLEQQPLYDRLAPKRTKLPNPNKARGNLEGTVLEVFVCRSAGGNPRLEALEFGRSHYLGTTNLFLERKVFEDIHDGESKTIAIGETLMDHAWALPRTGNSSNPPGEGSDFHSRHAGGSQFVFCDGSVHFIGDDIEPEDFRALCTLDGREVVNY